MRGNFRPEPVVIFTEIRSFGSLDHLPSNWPMVCWDLHQWAWHLGASKVYPQLQPPFSEDDEIHNALTDAHLHRRIYDHLAEYENQGRDTA